MLRWRDGLLVLLSYWIGESRCLLFFAASYGFAVALCGAVRCCVGPASPVLFFFCSFVLRP